MPGDVMRVLIFGLMSILIAVSPGAAADDARLAYIIDINGDTPVVTETGEMHNDRKFQNAVILPDGRVMAVGGNTSGQKFSDNGTVYAAEIWDPATGEWSVVDSMDVPRNYHSIALLQQENGEPMHPQTQPSH